jgi:magnesium transporter
LILETATATGRRIRDRAETAGMLAERRVPILAAGLSVEAARTALGAGGFAFADLLIVVDVEGRYQGAVPLTNVVTSPAAATLGDFIATDWPVVQAETDQERAVHIATAGGVAMLPVVTGDRRPLGLLTPTILLDVLVHEHHEDTNRLVGVLRARMGARHALEDPPLAQIGRRLPWLLIGLAMSAFAALSMASFEAALQSNIAIAFFIPSIVYLTDAIGTQTEAIAVRGLSQGHLPLGRVLANELATGALIGLVLGALAFAAVLLGLGDTTVATGVGLSLVFAGTIACGIGLLLPWALSRFGLDPAFGSGPVATILQDVLTILIYFVIMTWLTGAPAGR